MRTFLCMKNSYFHIRVFCKGGLGTRQERKEIFDELAAGGWIESQI